MPSRTLKANVSFNLNDDVRFHPRAEGLLVMRRFYVNLGLDPDVYAPKMDAQGFVKMPLWEMMNIFGPHLFMGPPTPIDTEIVLLGAEVPANAV